jgi:hypothetical protein
MRLTFIETAVFTRRVVTLGLEEELRLLELRLQENPALGAIDPGTGGVRKVRMGHARRGKGTRGGVRVHYLHIPARHLVYLLFVYSKEELDTLAPRQKQQLRVVVDAIKESARMGGEGGGH